MEQLELFDEPQPIKKWLHVWNEAERNKKATTRPSGNVVAEVMRHPSGTIQAKDRRVSPSLPSPARWHAPGRSEFERGHLSNG